MRHFLTLTATIFALTIPLISLRAADEPAVPSEPTFDQAKDSASKENKLVLLVFTGAWDANCARLDQSTFADRHVASLLRERAVLVHIDVLTNPELTAKYHVRDVPLMVLIKPDGTETDRWFGYQPPEKFLQEFGNTLAGHPTLERLRAEVKPAESQTRVQLCSTLINRGSYADGVIELRRLYEQLEFSTDKARHNQSTHTQVIRQFGSIREAYPPADEFLRAKRAAHVAEVSANPADSIHAQRVATIDWGLGQPDETLTFFHSLPNGSAAYISLKKPVFKILVKNRTYAEAVTLFPATEHAREIEIETAFLGMPIMQVLYGAIHASMPLNGGEFIKSLHKTITQSWTRKFEPFAGIQDVTGARLIAEKILKGDKSEEVVDLIAASARRALGEEAGAFLRSLNLPGLPPPEKSLPVASDDEPDSTTAPYEEQSEIIRLEPFVVTTRTTGRIPLTLGLPARNLKQKINSHVFVSAPSNTSENLMPYRNGVLLVAINGKSIKGQTWKQLGDFWLEGGEAGDQVTLILKGKGRDDCIYHQITVKRVRPSTQTSK
ncbi:MAG: thioredoxin family protein [Nibricoccus sp.]